MHAIEGGGLGRPHVGAHVRGVPEPQSSELAVLRERRRDRSHAIARGGRGREVLGAIPPEKLDDVVLALPQPLRQQLIPMSQPPVRRKFMIAAQPQQIRRIALATPVFLGKMYQIGQREQRQPDGRRDKRLAVIHRRLRKRLYSNR